MTLFTQTLTAEQEARVAQVGFDYRSRSKNEVKACNLCDSAVWTKLAYHDRYYHETDVYMCRSCGNVFITPVMIEEEYHEFYTRYYRPLVSAYHGRRIDAITLQDDQRPYADDLADLLRFQTRAGFEPRSILDVGGSTGITLKRLEKEFQRPPRLLCLDPAVNELHEARKLGVEVIDGFVETHNFGSARFDLVLMCQTIDHLVDIKRSLTKIHSILSTDGVLFVDVVDFRKVYLNTGSVEGAIKLDHCYYLTDLVTEAYLEVAGFDIIRKGIARDKVHINYVCKKTRPRPLNLEVLAAGAERMYAEIRQLRDQLIQR